MRSLDLSSSRTTCSTAWIRRQCREAGSLTRRDHGRIRFRIEDPCCFGGGRNMLAAVSAARRLMIARQPHRGIGVLSGNLGEIQRQTG
jgi:hypothetical protein